ncbi:hypothetical protein HOD83_00210 [Candidatus Woesearchaeota archaeon]|jgi:hypothetical protein|nr:hypothetical protein [Candidatus Woesearchaeota archaeon]MBT4114503.1 hypothetical protein [Candidatus Woesearchaeota archaeon]MBT4248002.1 hypothetical protein [Candidatus Woesearchaeota archaeon]
MKETNMPEFIQVEGLEEVQQEIRALNTELMEAMNQTDDLRHLMIEKNDLMNGAKDVSSMLIPEVRELNSFLLGKKTAQEHPTAAPRRKMGRPRKPRAIKAAAPKKRMGRPPKMPKALAMSLPKELRPTTHKKMGRPRKKPAQVVEVAERQNPLEELRKNLARLRDE